MTREQFQKSLVNQVYDFVFLHVSKGRTNDFINAQLKEKKMPQMTMEQLDGMREFFKKAEASNPAIVRKFAERLIHA